MAGSPHPVSWSLVVPVKGGPRAKSRLHPPPGVARSTLALALAQDCLAVCAEVAPPGRLFVVTADAEVVRMAAAVGGAVVPDRGEGLNAAVRSGRNAALATAGPESAVAVLLGDLPALCAPDLSAALEQAWASKLAMVPDATGTGTVLLTARRGDALDPRFGAGSARRHEDAGHRRIDLDLPRLRTDVDEDADLAAAVRLGVGPATRAALTAGLGPDVVTLPLMQASVHTFDDGDGSGSVLLDDGREVPFSARVFEQSALRHVRPGQRVSIDLDDEGAVARLWIVGIGDQERIG